MNQIMVKKKVYSQKEKKGREGKVTFSVVKLVRLFFKNSAFQNSDGS